jgi:hypothetical protein
VPKRLLAALTTATVAIAVLAAGAVALDVDAPRTAAAPAAEPATANLWVDQSGGSCSRAASPGQYRDASACGSFGDAWNACRPGDTVVVKSGTYGPQSFTGDKAAPGCTIRGEPGTTIADLVTAGAHLTLANVTVDVGEAKHAGWEARARDLTLRNVRLRGLFVRVDIYRAGNIRWLGGELGTAGQTGGRRVCGQDALPVQVGEADHITFDGIRFHPQDADPTPSACSANGFHLETIRLDGGTSFFTLRNSTFDSGDRSGTATVFITVPSPGSDEAPHDLTFENNRFGTTDSVVTFNVHSNVTRCVNLTFAYNTFLETAGLFQCTQAVNVRWIGNLGANGPSTPCFGTSINNVWQDPRRDSCGSDRWVTGPRASTSRLGLGGPDGFRLQRGSPAINAGERGGYCMTTLRARDHDGQGRPRGTRCDAGADEYDTPGPGPVATVVTAVGWRPTARRVLSVALTVGDPVAVEIELRRGNRTLASRSLRRLQPGKRTLDVPVPAGVTPGRARVRVLLQDDARDRKTVQRAVVLR